MPESVDHLSYCSRPWREWLAVDNRKLGKQSRKRARLEICKSSCVDASDTSLRQYHVSFQLNLMRVCVLSYKGTDCQRDRLSVQMLLPTSRNNPSVIECRYPEPPILRQRVGTPVAISKQNQNPSMTPIASVIIKQRSQDP